MKFLQSKVPWPIAVICGFSAAFGLVKGMLAVHLLAQVTILGTTVGPYQILALSAVDTFIGFLVLVAGLFLIMRRQWAFHLLRLGWAPLIAYEIGRELGMNASLTTELMPYHLLLKVVVFLCLLAVWKYLQSPVVNQFLAEQER